MLTFLQIILVVLKASGILNCSWVIIFIPLYVILVKLIFQFVMDNIDE